MSTRNLFNIDPLFGGDEDDAPEITGQFGVRPENVLQSQDQGAGVPMDMAAELQQIDEAAQLKVEELRDKGPWARYPTIDSPADEERERARLGRRGLKPSEIDRRITKFKQKGGKVKTSARMMQAAGMLADGIKGYLEVAGHPIARGGGMAEQVRQEGAAKIEQQIEDMNRISQQEKSLILLEDEREFKKYLADLKADRGLRVDLNKEARKLGIETKGKSLGATAKAVTEENARVGQLEEDIAVSNARRQQWQTSHNIAEDQLKTAIRAGDISTLPDEIIGAYFDLSPKDKGAIDNMRSSLETGMKAGAFEDAEDLLLKMQRRELQERELAEEPEVKLTPEEKQEQAVDTAKKKEAGIAMQKAERSYQEDLPGLATMYWQMKGADQSPEGKQKQAQILMAATGAKQKATGLSLQEARLAVIEDFETIQGMLE